MAEKIRVASLDIDVDAVLKSSQRFLTEINRLKAAQKELRDSGQESSKAFAENDANLKNLSKSYRDNQKFAASLLAVNKDLDLTMRAEGKSTLELLDSRRQLQEISKQIIGNSDQEIALRNKLNNAIDAQTAQLRDQQSEFNASKDKIGEYKQAIEESIPANSVLGRAIAGVTSVLNVVRPIYNAYKQDISDSISIIFNAARGTEGMTKAQKAGAVATNILTGALKLFRVALAATGIGLIVVALGSLVAFLGSTQEGIDKVNSVLKPLQVIFGRLFDVVQKFGKAIFEAFSEPQELIRKIGDLIKNNLEVRFEALRRIIQRVVNFDFKGIGEDLSQAATGVENIGEKTAAFFNKAKGFLGDAVALGKQLADIQIQIEQGEIALIQRRAELQKIIKAENLIAEDITRSVAEREAAAQRSLAANQELLGLEQKQLDLLIQQQTLENSINDTSREDEKALAELKAQRLEAETRALELQTTQTNKLNQIRQQGATQAAAAAKEREALLKEEADKAIRSLELELEEFRILNEEKLALDGELNAARIEAAINTAFLIKERELEILQEKLDAGLISEQEANVERLKLQSDFNAQRAAADADFQKQQEELAAERREKEKERQELEEESRLELRLLKAEDEFAFRQIQLDAQREQEIAAAEKLGADTTAIDEKYKNLAAKLDIDRRKAQTENAQQAFGEFGALAQSFAGDNKRLQTSLALVDTFLGAQKAYLSQLIPGEPTSLPRAIGAAIKATAFGLANVAKISGTKFARGGLLTGPLHSQGGIQTPYGELEGGEAVINRRATRKYRGLLSVLNASTGGRKFATGGILGSSNALVQSSFTGGSASGGGNVALIDYDLMAAKNAEAIRHLPNPVVGVDEITKVSNRVAVVEQGANV